MARGDIDASAIAGLPATAIGLNVSRNARKIFKTLTDKIQLMEGVTAAAVVYGLEPVKHRHYYMYPLEPADLRPPSTLLPKGSADPTASHSGSLAGGIRGML